jgi:transcriptional regulator with XRE-family HTH domain
MSKQPAALEWNQADRMRKALRHAGVGMQEMADYLGVSRTSTSNWTNGRILPSITTLRAWAMRTGVPFERLCHGSTDPCSPLPRSRGAARCPR